MRNVFPYKAKLYHLHIACQMDTDSLISRSSAGFLSPALPRVNVTWFGLEWFCSTNFRRQSFSSHGSNLLDVVLDTQKKNLHSFLFYFTYKRI